MDNKNVYFGLTFFAVLVGILSLSIGGNISYTNTTNNLTNNITTFINTTNYINETANLSTKMNKTGESTTGTYNFDIIQMVASTSYIRSAGSANSRITFNTNVGGNANNINVGASSIFYPTQSSTNPTYIKGGFWYNTTSNQSMIGAASTYNFVASSNKRGLTLNITVLTALPSTFSTLEFQNGVLVNIT